MILQLLGQFLNNLDRCSASFRLGLSLRFPCPLPKRISSRILSKCMLIPQNHPKSQQRVRTCAVKEKSVFRASLALSMLENGTRSHISSDRVRSGYEINERNKLTSLPMCGFTAQLVECRTGIAEVTGSNPVVALIFNLLLPSNYLNWKIYCDDHSSLS